MNLHFVTLNLTSTYRKLNLPLTSDIYFELLPLEMQKRLEQTEATTRGILLKMVFLEIPQNSQENTCTRVSFLQADLQLY